MGFNSFSFIAIPSQKGKENQKPKGYWLSLDNRRKFFLQFAKDMGFPAESIDKWKQVTNAQILAKEVNHQHISVVFSNPRLL